MRRIALLLLLSAGSSGCVDALGVGSSCTLEMAEVTGEYGPPDSRQESESRGNHTVAWYYDSNPRIKFEFRWGTGYDRCQVTQGSFQLIPDDPQLR